MRFCLMKNLEEDTKSQPHKQRLENTFGEANFDFISNLFNIQEQEDHCYAQWQNKREELNQLIKLESQSTNSIVLTDLQLESWLKTEDKNGLSVGVYEVNHMLLHAMIVPMTQWSEYYTLHLSELAKWLLHPGDKDVSAFTKSYPGYLLANIYFLSLVRLNIDIEITEEEISAPIYEEDGASFLWFGNSYFIETLDLPSNRFSHQQKEKIINLLKGYFDVMVLSDYDLEQLRAMPKEKLDDTQKEIIYDELKEKISQKFKPSNSQAFRSECPSQLFFKEQQATQDGKDNHTPLQLT